MSKSIPLSHRVIVSGDFKPPTDITDPALVRHWLRNKFLSLVDTFHDRQIISKANTVLRVVGFELNSEVTQRGHKLFDDLKLVDIGETLATDGACLRRYAPAILTVKAEAGPGIRQLKAELPDTIVLAVTVPTTFKEEDVRRIYGLRDCETIADVVERLTSAAMFYGADGIVCAPSEASRMRALLGPDPWIVTPNVRFSDQAVTNDDQAKERGSTPAGAILAGADCVVMGRPIVNADDPVAAYDRAVAEIAAVV